MISHNNVDPEDVYSTVAYEKGFHMVYYLEQVVGRENFDKFIPHYFSKWSFKSLDSFEFRDTYMNFFNETGDEEIKKKIAAIDWNDRLYARGLPPKPDFDTTLANQCFELANKWKDSVCVYLLVFMIRCTDILCSRLYPVQKILKASPPIKSLFSLILSSFSTHL